MRQQNKLYLLLAILGIANMLQAQIPVGSWRTHLSYGQGSSVTASDQVIYSISDGSLYTYRIDDQSVTTYSKLDGLSDVFMSMVRYDKSTDKLLMGYENGNIDILEGNSINNIPDIKLNTISGSKEINNLRFKDGFAYMAFDFGIVVLNMERYEIKETYQLNFGGVNNPVNDVEFQGDTLFAATKLGIYYGLLSDNLIDTRNWKVYEEAPENEQAYYFLGTADDLIFGATSTNGSRFSVYVLNGLNQKKVGDYNNLTGFQEIDDRVFFYATTTVFSYNKNLVLLDSQSQYDLPDYPESESAFKVNDAFAMSGDLLFTSDNVLGLVKVDWKVQSALLTPSGPEQNSIRRISLSPAGLRMVHGGVTSSWNTLGNQGSVSQLKVGQWENLNLKNTPVFTNKRDFMDLAVDPNDPEHFVVTSWGYNVFEIQGDEVINEYDEFNSSLQNIIPGGPYVRTSGVTFDNEGNLWIANSQVSEPISCLTATDEWVGLAYSEIDDGGGNGVFSLGEIMVSNDNNMWVVVPRNRGLFVFNTNGTIDDISDDDRRFFSVFNDEDEDISTDIYDIVQDLDGTIWVGTASGPVLYYNVNSVFEASSFPGYRIKIPRNDGTGRADYLLAGEKIQSIAVDGGNRKWIGTTTSGLFLVSPDGLETLEHFTVDNSPLLSNTILDLEIDNESGEVFIATDKGLISYRSDATGGGADFSDIRVFPNPVREDYTGDIIVSGLVAETNVKITDISGNLVYETTSNGGTASWNATNFYGQKVGTGVYLIFCSDKTGENSAMVKVMVIN